MNSHTPGLSVILSAALLLGASAAASTISTHPLVETSASPRGRQPSRYLIKLRDPSRRQQATRLLQTHGLRVRRFVPEISLYIADGRSRGRPNAADLQALLKSSQFEYAERNATWYANRAPNDELYPLQGEVQRMEVDAAWDATTGSREVTVAVTDSGIALEHPDLRNQLWTNPAGGPDLHGYNFVNNTLAPEDDNGHGTHVAGIIGAEGNNAAGVAGVTWHTQLMALKFLSAAGTGSTDAGIDAILYAANHGARLINASWGGGPYSRALEDAITYAYEHGALVVAAAGNDGVNVDSSPHYPSGYRIPGVLAVGSSRAAGTLSSFSNFGAVSVALVAPGSDVLSTLLDAKYGRKSGTSMAAPMATGVGALILSLHPELTPLQLRNALLNSADPRATYAGKVATEGDLSAKLAIQQLSGGFQVWPARISLGVGETFEFTAYKGSGTVHWSVADASIASIDARGVLQGVAKGSTHVSAKDATGATVTTQWVRIGSSPPPPGGCGGADQQADLPANPLGEASAALSLGLPALAAFLVRKRRG